MMLSRVRTAGLLSVILLAACARGPESPEGTRGYILLSIDTLRADHLGSYGHERETSPFIDSLAARGALFENAYVQLPGTLPSHMSIFTGLYPAEHGVYPPNGVLSERIKTLPEMLSAAGFRTAGHTEGGYVHGSFGFARGFSEFSDEAYEVECDVERTLARGMNFLERLGSDERFFLFLHTYVVHDPYPDVRSPEAYHFPMETYRKPFWPGDPPADSVEPTGPLLTALNRQDSMPGEEVLDYYRAIYDSQIRFLDDRLRDFFSRLESMGLLDETTIVITSDHGEGFAEHGRLLHEQVYREELHVPLIVVHPDFEPGLRIRQLVESIDIAPTLLELADVEPAQPMSGDSLLPLLLGSAPEGPREAFAEGIENSERAILRQTENELHHLVFKPRDLRAQGSWMSRELSFDTFEEELEFELESFYEPRQLEILVNGEPVGVAGQELPREASGIWVSGEVAFDAPEDQVRLVLESFHRPRWVEIFVGSTKLSEVPRVQSAPGVAGQSGDASDGARPGEVRVETSPVTVEFSLPANNRRSVRLRSDGCEVPADLGLSADRRCLAFQILEDGGIDRVRQLESRVRVQPRQRALRVDLPGVGKKRVTLRADSCGVPAELGLSDDSRCLSFRLTLPEIWHVELFDNLRDPGQGTDLSAQRSDLSQPMLRSLNRYRFEPVAPAESSELPPELEARLRALGYLP